MTYTVSGPRYHNMYFVMHVNGIFEVIDGMRCGKVAADELAQRLNAGMAE